MSKELELDLRRKNGPFKIRIPTGWKVKFSGDERLFDLISGGDITLVLTPPETDETKDE